MPARRPDPSRIHQLEYELGFRDDAPHFQRSAQSLGLVNNVIKEIWTDDYAASIAGSGTRITSHPQEPGTWLISTDGHDEYTTVRIEREAFEHRSFATLVSLEFDDALNAHRGRLASSDSPS